MRAVLLVLAVAAAVGTGASLLVRSGRTSEAENLRAELGRHIERGGIADLGHAQTLGRWLLLSRSDDREIAAAVAFTNAVLAVDYGLATARETEDALARGAPERSSGEAADTPIAMREAARALVSVSKGDWHSGAHLAEAAIAASPGNPHALYALGRARAFGGDLHGASRALEAAIVGSPGFFAARVSWAEARLDLGDLSHARAALEHVLADSPKDLRARLLLDEVEQAEGRGAAGTLTDVCPPQSWTPPAIATGCALSAAVRARRSGAHADARTHVQAAAGAAPSQPRLLARTALVMAQLGAVDRAAALLEKAGRLVGPPMPALAWATVAVALGRGRSRPLPGGPRPADPETRLMVARAALAEGGAGGLATALKELGDKARKQDLDLRTLARLNEKAPGPGAADDPVRAYVDGLRARLAGDLPAAAEQLRGALAGHGDACRAAGEYVATMRALKRVPDAAALAGLRAENRTCVNVR